MEHNTLQIKRVLITGATGFIGEHVCKAFADLDYDVHGVSRNKQSKKKDITWWTADLSNFTEVEKIVAKINPDIVIHLAGEVTGSRELKIVRPTYENIATSTLNILEIVTRLSINRLVLVGSMEESDKITDIPGSPYVAAKMTASLYARLFHALYKTPVVTLRLFMVYGPHQKDLTKIIPYTITSILSGKTPSFSSGNRKVDWIYVNDVVRAIVASATARNVEGRVIDIGTGIYTSIKEVVTLIASRMKYRKILGFGKLPDRKFENEKKANPKKAKNYLNWYPKVTLMDGITKTIDSYKNKTL